MRDAKKVHKAPPRAKSSTRTYIQSGQVLSFGVCTSAAVRTAARTFFRVCRQYLDTDLFTYQVDKWVRKLCIYSKQQCRLLGRRGAASCDTWHPSSLITVCIWYYYYCSYLPGICLFRVRQAVPACGPQ